MELRNYVRVLRRRWLLIAACVVGVLALTGASIALRTQTYASTTRLFVSTSQSDTTEAYQGGLFSAQRVTSYADLAASRELAEAVIARLDLDVDPTELVDRVSASVVPETVILALTVTDPDPETAQALSQTFAEQLVDDVRRLETPEDGSTPPIKVTIFDSASLPLDPVSPQPVRDLGLGLLLGLLAGIAAAITRDLLDTSVTSYDDISAVVDAPLLGAIAHDSSARSRALVTSLDSHAPRVEAFRVLRTNLQFVDVDSSEKVYVLTSALPEEGKTSTAVNLAITLAQAGQRTLLVECDLRRPKATEALGLDPAVGVTTVLLGRVSLEEAIQKHPGSDLHVLAGGARPPNPAELLQSQAMSDLVASLRRAYDIVILDAPPLLPVTDAALLASLADGALVVVRHGRTTRDQLAHAVERLAQVDAKTVGVVFNMVPSTRRGSYGYGYGYGYGEEPAGRPT